MAAVATAALVGILLLTTLKLAGPSWITTVREHDQTRHDLDGSGGSNELTLAAART